MKTTTLARYLHLVLLTVLVCIGTATTHAQEKPMVYLLNGDFSQDLNCWAASPTVAMTVLPTTEIPVNSDKFPKKILRNVVTPKSGDKPHSAQIVNAIRRPLNEGEILTIRFWARSPQSLSITGDILESVPPYAALTKGKASFVLTPEWKQYEFIAVAPQAFERLGTRLVIAFGSVPGQVDLADLKITSADHP
jgi:hypothetical protein